MAVINSVKSLLLLGVLASPLANATLIGQWTFDGSNALIDTQGNFGSLELTGNASIANGQLDVNGSGAAASGWARASGYTGPSIGDKTLVSWVTLQSLSNVAYAGSAMTIDALGSDRFDGIVYGERETDKWMSGSSGFSRTQDFSPGFQETTTNTLVQMAFTYDNLISGQVQITGYRNGVNIGTYLANNAATWTANDTEIFFGIRHGDLNGGPGALDALISEARLYDTVLSQAQIQALTLQGTSVPEPETLALLALGLGLLGYSRQSRV